MTKPTLTKYSASWCVPCQALSMTIKETDLSNFNFIEVDIDQDPLSTAQAGVRSVPTLIITQEGQELKRTTGNKTQLQLKDFLCLE